MQKKFVILHPINRTNQSDKKMIKNLVIVESPNKVKKVGQYLGPDFTVMSSYGHIRDLKKKNFGVDIAHDFQPEYEVSEDKKTLVAELKKKAKEAQTVWLATDEDREGEAIAWHLYEVLKLRPENTRRIVFQEITKEALQNAVKNPRQIDLNLVDAQQARRVIDRIVGFELSPVLWKKIKPALSAGRVQSVAVRLIMEREEEIRNFKSEAFYRINADFELATGEQLRAELSRRLADKEQAGQYLSMASGAAYSVASVNVRPVKKSPAPPFTTSTLQQEAGRKLGFTVNQTMNVAQRLYEAGHISYMRTDSVNLSNFALDAIKKEIEGTMGSQYVAIRHYQTKSKGAQEAHEAIRPTYMEKSTISGTAQEQKLYNLIWKRTIASQMADAVIEKTTIDIAVDPAKGAELPEAAQGAHFSATGEVVKFDGFLRVYLEGKDEEGDDELQGLLPAVKEGMALKLDTMTATQRFTKHPSRYTEPLLVKKMEEIGIGRPATYASIVSTIQQREYIARGESDGVQRDFTVLTLKHGKITEATRSEKVDATRGKLVPTDIGEVVNAYLTTNFPDILDYNFTAQIEEKFDEIANGKLPWSREVKSFYTDFHPEVERAANTHTEHRVGERMLGTDPATGKPVSVKIGRFGPMIQLGDGEGEEKPQFASLLKGQSVGTITLEEALALFAFPRNIGDYEDKPVTVAIGRFGPYVKHDGKFVSIPAAYSPEFITLEEAITLIDAKRQQEANRLVKSFPEDATIEILNGRYGKYIRHNSTNYKIPRTVADPEALTLEECREIIAKQDAKPARPRAKKKK